MAKGAEPWSRNPTSTAHMWISEENAPPNSTPKNPLDQALAALAHRTPEETARLCAEALAAIEAPQALPPGKSLMEVVGEQWPGSETDEEVAAALEHLP